MKQTIINLMLLLFPKAKNEELTKEEEQYLIFAFCVLFLVLSVVFGFRLLG